MAERSLGDFLMPFVLGMVVGGTCIFPRGCDYQPPRVVNIGDVNNDGIADIRVVETHNQSRVYISSKDEYLPFQSYLDSQSDINLRESVRKNVESILGK
jgi:hypothetical protein